MGSGGCCYSCEKWLINSITYDEMLLCRDCYKRIEKANKEFFDTIKTGAIKLEFSDGFNLKELIK